MPVLSSASALSDAVRSTTLLIELRAARFRNLVVMVVVVGLTGVAWALVTMSWQPLAALALMVPLCGRFLLLDAQAVGRWRRQILSQWQNGGLDLDAFSRLAAAQMLPKDTLRGMLNSLPTRGSAGPAPCDIGTLRNAAAMIIETIDRYQYMRTAFSAVNATVAVACLAWAAVAGKLLPVVGLTFLPLLFVSQKWLTESQFRSSHRRLRQLGLQNEPGRSQFAEFAPHFDWSGVPLKTRTRLLEAFALANPAQSGH
jgi:hypothetical protein